MSAEVLVCYQSKKFLEEIEGLLLMVDGIRLVPITSIENLLEPEDEDLNPLLTIQESLPGNTETNEWLQTAKMSYPHVPVMVLYSPNDEVKTQHLVKNGASFALQRPFDDEFIMDAILQIVDLKFSKSIPVAALEAIRVRDLVLGTDIDFDLFTHLPSNSKTLCLRRKGATVDQDLLDKALKGKGQQLYVMKSELPGFFSYVSKNLRAQGKKDVVSMTEKAIKMKAKVQKFIGILLDSDLKDFDQGKEIFQLCEEIIQDLNVTSEKSPEELYEQIIQLTERPRTNYNAAINVCVYACTFAQVLKFPPKEVEDIALAAILHNVGLSKLSIDAARKPVADLNAEELDLYRSYPMKSMIMVKAKRVPLEEDICKAIEQHMENCDGTGFPKKLRQHMISSSAKVLRIAKEFNRMTSLESGNHEAVTPGRAFDILREANNPAIGETKLDFSYVRKLGIFFTEMSDKVGKKGA